MHVEIDHWIVDRQSSIVNRPRLIGWPRIARGRAGLRAAALERASGTSRINRSRCSRSFVGELEEDLLARGVLEALAVFLKNLCEPSLAADADEQRLLVVDALVASRRPRRTARWRRP